MNEGSDTNKIDKRKGEDQKYRLSLMKKKVVEMAFVVKRIAQRVCS